MVGTFVYPCVNNGYKGKYIFSTVIFRMISLHTEKYTERSDPLSAFYESMALSAIEYEKSSRIGYNQ